ncbi:MAG: septum formation initiator family protein [Flavobacteriaceae bacterium]|nr:septum formation initiator family protein [Flavobacteriaceae bacterium]
MKKFFLNKYLLILIGFGVWMYFFDDNSIQMHNELNKEIQKLESSIDFYKQEIKKDKKLMEDYENPEELERFARETYQMKKDSEDVYLIEVDSVK